MFFRKDIRYMNQTPTGYRPAWNEPWRHRVVCFPIGIHYLAILYRWWWRRSYWYPTDRIERLYHAAYERGRRWERRFWARIGEVPPLDADQKADSQQEYFAALATGVDRVLTNLKNDGKLDPASLSPELPGLLNDVRKPE